MDIFVSFSSADEAVARWLQRELTGHGAKPWTFRQARIGESLPQGIRKALDQAHAVIALISKAYIDSRACQIEWEYARYQGKSLLPILIEISEETKQFVAELTWLAASTADERQLAMTRLREVLNLTSVSSYASDFRNIIVDPGVVDLQLRDLQRGSHLSRLGQKRMYVWPEGARSYIDLCANIQYEGPQRFGLFRETLQRWNLCDAFESFISFGPGDGITDAAILDHLLVARESFQYLPVDISLALLTHTIAWLPRRIPRIRPFLSVTPLHADFEDQLDGVLQKIASVPAPRPALLGLMGNTLGNLERGETDFLDKVGNWMRDGDRLLFEVATRRADVPAVNDVYSRIDHYPEPLRKLFATPVSKISDLSLHELTENFAKYFSVRMSTTMSNIPGGYTYTVSALVDGLHLDVASVTRYDSVAIGEYLERLGMYAVFHEVIPGKWADAAYFLVARK